MFLGDTQFVTDDACRELLPISPPLYDPETLTDRPERFIASEIVRSALFQVLKKELPYCCEVRIREFKEPKEEGEVIRITADVLVERDSQKVIVIGKNGAQVKEIGVIAREKLEAFFRHQIFLNLSVKVDKDWRKNTRKLTEYGYMKPKK
jgi:GTP-binding protein Era